MKIKIDGITFKKWQPYGTTAYIRGTDQLNTNNPAYSDYWILIVGRTNSNEWSFAASSDWKYLGELFNKQNPNGLMQATNAKEAKKEADKFLMQIAKLQSFA